VGKAKARWVDILSEIVWSYHTTVQSTTKETPLNLVYGMEAMLHIEIKIPSKRVGEFEEQESAKGTLFHFDTNQVAMKMTKEAKDKAHGE